MRRISVALLPILTALGCVGTEDTETVVWNLNISEWIVDDPIAGATVAIENMENSEFTTDANGDVALEVVPQDYATANMVADGFPNTTFHDYIGEQDWRSARNIPSQEYIDDMNELFELEIDPSNAQMVAVHVLDCDPDGENSDCAYSDLAFVSLTAEYELAFVVDIQGGLDYNGASLSGFSRGNNVIDGAVMFTNVKAGSVGLNIDIPCLHEPTFEVTAKQYIDVTAYCSRE